MVREANPEDRAQLRELCDACFPEDPKSFTDWVFSERIEREIITVVERDGRVAAAVHALPQKIRVRDAALDGALIGFVGTLPEYRCQGLMRQVMGGCMESLRRRGVAVAVHRPVQLELYYKLGHFDIAEAQFLDMDASVPRRRAEDVADVDISSDIGAIFKCYDRYQARYSVMAVRRFYDFTLKCSDYLSCGAKCVAVMGEKEVEGYCVYFDEAEELIGEECVALSQEAYGELCRALAWRAGGKKLTIRLAPDIRVALPGAAVRLPTRTVMGVVNVSKLLPAAGFSRFNVAVEDTTVSENNGTFSMTGERTDDLPQLRMKAGYLAQWITGYKSLRELEEEGNARVLDPLARDMMYKLKKHPCYIVDEY